MDLERLTEVARAFVSDARLHRESVGIDSDTAEEARQDVIRAVPAVQAIARALDGAPDPEEFMPDEPEHTMYDVLNAGLRLVGALEFQVELADAVEARGPRFAADSLHSWVWDAARSLWADGHYRQAVLAAASQIDYHLQAKLARPDISGAKLAQEAFSLDDPKPGRSRLRFAWVEVGSERYTSVHEGALSFGVGVAKIIRNTAAHAAHEPLTQVVALEHLACLSYWARLIDHASVVDASVKY